MKGVIEVEALTPDILDSNFFVFLFQKAEVLA